MKKKPLLAGAAPARRSILDVLAGVQATGAQATGTQATGAQAKAGDQFKPHNFKPAA